ncbi:MAG: DUF2238 domain-containing protein [Candidatus Thioglobus sp.]|nr:DUF2238 domain-containing protein [Candidatus Thioglobus pontius]MBL6984246.1 DUF2238 domain-containing protein [Candidatus Thioglobus sp.]
MNKTKSIAPTLLIIFLVFWGILAINPMYRNIWFAENIILIICISYLIFHYPSYQFSNTAYWLIFIFCILQTIGAHYTYAQVPFGFWVAELLDLQRNHFDRLVHFAFGFLIILPFKEKFDRVVSFSNHRIETFTLVMIFIGIGASYEILEWWYAEIYEQDSASNMFLGSQGDIWDAEKDVFLSGLGAWLFLTIFNKVKKL